MAGLSVGELFASLKLDTRGFEQGLASAKVGLQGVDAQVGKTGGFFKGLGDTLSKTAATAMRATAVGVAGLGAGLLGTSVAGFKMNATLDTVRAQMEAFTGSQERAAEVMKFVQQEAAATAFDVGEMGKATASLIPASKASGVAIQDLVKQAEILSAVNPEEGLEGAAFALREALSGDFTSVIERFNIPRQRLNELKEQGVPAMEAISTALKEMGIDFSIVEKQAATLPGQWDLLTGTFSQLAGTVTKPVFDVVAGHLTTLNARLAENMPQIEAVAAAIGGRLVDGFTFLGNAGKVAIGFFQDVGSTIRNLLDSTLVPGVSILDGFRVAFSKIFSGDLSEGFSLLMESIGAFGGQLGEKLSILGQMFVDWIGPKIPPMLVELGRLLGAVATWVVTTALPAIVERLGKWAAAFIDWVGPQIPKLIDELQKLLERAGSWLADTALPAIAGNLAKWGLALIEWVVPRIPGLLVELGKLLADMLGWIVGTALPGIIKQLGEWGWAFLNWIGDIVLPQLPGKLNEIKDSLATWFTGTAIPRVKELVGDLAQGIIDRFNDSKQSVIDTLKSPFEWIRDNVGSILETAVKNALRKLDSAGRGIGEFVAGAGRALNSIFDALDLGHPFSEANPWQGIPGLATGGSVVEGGLTKVGEKGTELLWLPPGAKVIPHDPTEKILAGVDSGPMHAVGGPVDVGKNILAGVKSVAAGAFDTITDWMQKGASWVVNQAFDAFGVGLDLPGLMSSLGGAVFSKIKSAAIEMIHTVLEGLAAGGDWVKPLLSYIVTQEYGPASGALGYNFHTGIDLAGPPGSMVRAAKGGRVASAGWNDGYGNAVILEHANNLRTLYGHMRSIMVSLGEMVRSGQPLGPQGSTGNSTGAHLHFETMQNGIRVNPRNFIPALASGGVFNSPTLALLAETARAQPEIVTPERLMRQIVREELGGLFGPAGIAHAGNEQPIHVHVTSVLDGRKVGESVAPVVIGRFNSGMRRRGLG